MDEFPSTWEVVSTDKDYESLRLRVPGGWVLSIRDQTNNDTNALFIADPSNFWKLA